MYRFSRAIYRELAPLVVEDPQDPSEGRHDLAVLDACERAMKRLTTERHSSAVARSLFEEIRPYFRLRDQPRVWRVVRRNVHVATEFRARFPSLVPVDEPHQG